MPESTQYPRESLHTFFVGAALVYSFPFLFVLSVCRLGSGLKMKIGRLNSEEQSEIVGVHKAGAKGVEITAKLGHPKITVYTTIKRFESCETVEGEKSISRP